MRFLPLNRKNFIVELNDLGETMALLSRLQAAPLPGITAMIPAARTLMLTFTPEIAKAEDLALMISKLDLGRRGQADDHLVEVPVNYNGEDLPEVAELTGLSVQEIIRRHTGGDYMVAFCGFAPGFGYLAGGDPSLRVPRRRTPRTKIPAGSVGLAGEFSGVYPRESPGGWQLIGTTPMKMWDIAREPPALFQPGYRVRFVDLAATDRIFSIPEAAGAARAPERAEGNTVRFTVTASPLPALFQDLGRFGESGQGVSASGALDRAAFRSANAVVGNSETEPCLELAGGFSFRTDGAAVIGIAGAPCTIKIRSATEKVLNFITYEPIPLEAGDEVTLSAPEAGARCYLSLRGGFAVEPVLGSAATDTLAQIGPEPVRAGSVLRAGATPGHLSAVSLDEAPSFAFPKPGDTVTLDIELGPRTDWFTAAALERLTGTAWEVTAQSNRVALRLGAAQGLERGRREELPSEGVVTGALEIPPDGKPLLFLADHPLTGGYPVIGAVAEHHLDLAGQLPSGAKIRFRALAPFHEIKPEPKENPKPQGAAP